MPRVKAALKVLVFGAGETVRPIRAGLLRGHRFHVDPAHRSQRLLGFEEREIAETLRSLTRDARSAVDIGAHDGWYTVFFAGRAGIRDVVACEPRADHRERMIRNLSLQPQVQAGKVRCVERAIGSAPDEVTLDSVLDGMADPVIVKIDVDGGELDVLASGRRQLSARDVRLVIETHSAILEASCLELLAMLGFRCRVIDHAWYRIFLPEHRPIPHNRWLDARKGPE